MIRESPRKLVVVTGTPRSGTTPVGDALAAGAGVRTLYEPLNFHVGDRRVQRYFEVPGAGGFSNELADDLVRDIASLRLDLRRGIFPEDRGARRLLKRVTGSRTTLTYRQCRLDPRLKTVVWKDPFAALLVDRVAQVQNLPVVATVRPPAAVAASFKRLDWKFDVSDLVDRLASVGVHYRAQTAGLDLQKPVHNAAALWHIVNSQLLAAASRYRHVVLVDMDDVVANPAAVLEQLHGRVGLEWTSRARDHAASMTATAGPAKPDSSRAHVASRDTRAANRYWSEVLDDDEVSTVRDRNDELWQRIRSAAFTARPPRH